MKKRASSAYFIYALISYISKLNNAAIINAANNYICYLCLYSMQWMLRGLQSASAASPSVAAAAVIMTRSKISLEYVDHRTDRITAGLSNCIANRTQSAQCA